VQEPPGTGQLPSISIRRPLKLLPLIGLVFVLSAGGSFGPEEIVPASGPGVALLLLLAIPIFYGLPLGLLSGEMASRFPVEGGYYRWVRIVFGDFWGFMAGWSAWIGAFCDGAVYIVFASEYAQVLMKQLEAIPPEAVPLLRQGFVLVVIAACTWANVRGIQLVGWSATVFAVLVISPFLLMGFLGLARWDHNPFVPMRVPGQGWFESLGAGALIAMWCYSGYESLSTAAEELEDPRRNYLKAILISLVVTIPVYFVPLLGSLAFTDDWSAIHAGNYTQIAWAIGGAGLGAWIAGSGMLSNINLFNAYTLAYSRIPFTMAQDGFMPKILARTHARHGTPWVSILVGAVIYLLLTRFSIDTLLVVEMWLFSLIYILLYLALWTLRRRPELDAPPERGAFRFTIPAGKWGIWLVISPPLALILIAALGSWRSYVVYSGPALLSGVVLYPLARWYRNHRRTATPP
jgi:amino acid transporter